ncbi:AMP-binding protein [Polaribacter sp.]|uniref:AMP-binding protein n=1 Tax=Polaribacter sp. TaxID=1920175 RepID=UPI0025EEA832|nr:AMP-binding protein [Polaribacter sp.]
MNSINFHKDLKLNGYSFSSNEDLLRYVKTISKDIALFLEEWFNDKDYIIVKTSGSSGVPKHIQLHKKLVVNSAKATSTYFELPSKTTALLCLPINYIAGKMMLVRSLTLGWHLDIGLISSSPLDRNDKTYDFSAMVPLQVENSLQNLHKIRKLIVGGGSISNLLLERLKKNTATQIYETYGMTETITHIAIKPIQSSVYSISKNSTSYFKTLPGVTIYKDIRNCLVIKAPEITKEVVFTNDVVNLISDNQFEWLGRFDNIINSGGIKLNPEYIERKIAKIISYRFFIASIFDKKLGEKVILVVECEKESFNKLNLNIFKELTKFETPKNTYFLKEFITTESGKIQRNKTLKLVCWR